MKQSDKIDRVYMTVTYDVGWSTRSSSTRYDKKMGHVFIIGAPINEKE